MDRFKNIILDQGGYSMIEILTVVFILAILTAVAVPKYMTMQAEATESACGKTGFKKIDRPLCVAAVYTVTIFETQSWKVKKWDLCG